MPGAGHFNPEPNQRRPLKLSVKQSKQFLIPDIKNRGDKRKIAKRKLHPKQPIAKTKIKDNTKPESEKVEVMDSKAEAMLRYQDMIKRKIQQQRQYPSWAAKKGIEGVSHLEFTLFADGRVGAINLLASSGSSILDRAAVDTIKRAAPFKPIPPEFNRSSLTLEISLVFKLDKDQ
jgi:protein TonB